jgi:hypothetical protein
MPSTEAPNWWADVQQDREDLAGRGRRPAEDWLGEELDFAPRRRMTRRDVATHDTVEHEATAASTGADHALHGVFIPATSSTGARSMTIELGGDGDLAASPDDLVVATPADVAHELRHLAAADDPFATPPPPPGQRRTVAIKGRPQPYRLPSQAQRHRGRTTSDRVGARPDRIALWAVVLGAILILVAATTSSSQAAVPHRVAAPQAHHAAHQAKVHSAKLHHRATVSRAALRAHR